MREDSSLRKRWRKRLAISARRFRRLRGRWPDRQIMEAAKRGIDQAVAAYIQPPPLEN